MSYGDATTEQGPREALLETEGMTSHPVEVLAQEFTERCRRGEGPSIEDYATKYPALADEIRDVFSAVLVLEGLKPGQSDTASHLGEDSASDGESLVQLGDYRIVREIGRGGMGVVYEAVQQSLGRRVALKVLPSGPWRNEKRRQRFQREAQAAAKLHHTNIVPVFGVGEQGGVNYYVMQYIEGVGLDRRLEELAEHGCPDRETTLLPREPGDGAPADSPAPAADHPSQESRSRSPYWHEVADVGRQAAQALAYAHQQGTLHRDVKPANLLLTSDGTVWITDFGLAKNGDAEDLTRSGDVLGTLRYMSPEQFRGEADLRSDVYSLGLTLYELVALRPAFDAEERSQLIRQVMGEEPPRPRRLDPRIPADLETIVLKAISREPGRRYQTADDLAEDLQSFAEGRPIKARRVSGVGRLWLWSRRNPTVAALVALAAGLLVTTAAVGWAGYVHTKEALAGESRQLRKTEAEQTRAERNLKLAMEAFDQVFDRIAPPGGAASLPATEDAEPEFQPVVSARDARVLEDLVRFYEQFATENQDNAHLQLETAKANHKLGQLQNHLGRFEKAQAALQSALKFYERLSQGAREADLIKVARATALNDLAHSLQMTGHHEEAREAGLRALQILGTAVAVPGTSAKARFAAAKTHQNLCIASFFSRRRQDAVAHGQKAHALLKGLIEGDPQNPAYRLALAVSHRNQSFGSRRHGGPGNRTESLEEAVLILEKLIEEYPAHTDCRFEFVRTVVPVGLRGGPHRAREELSETWKERLRQAHTYATELTRESPGVPAFEFALAEAGQGLAGVLQAEGRPDEAAPHHVQAVEALSRLAEESPSVMMYRMSVTRAFMSYAGFLREQNRLAEACAIVERGIEQTKRLPQRDGRPMVNPMLLRQYQSLAEIYTEMGETEKAAAISQEATKLREQFRPAGFSGRFPFDRKR